MKMLTKIHEKYQIVEASDTSLTIDQARHLINVAMMIVRAEDEKLHKDEYKTATTKLQEALHWLQDK